MRVHSTFLIGLFATTAVTGLALPQTHALVVRSGLDMSKRYDGDSEDEKRKRYDGDSEDEKRKRYDGDSEDED